MIKAPWTEEQVKALEFFQNWNDVHPFTCPNRGDGNHPYFNHDRGILVPTVSGWVCPSCDYIQDWAHEHMLDMKTMEQMKASFDKILRRTHDL